MSSPLLDDDEAIALRIVGALITIGLVALLAFAVGRVQDRAPAAAAAPAVAAAPLPAPPADARVVVDNGVVKFYFASGSSQIALGANEALAGVVSEVQAGKSVVISGFHDSTGDPARNAELAKERAQAVQAALVALGISADKTELMKPLEMSGSGDNAEARRVEVTLR